MTNARNIRLKRIIFTGLSLICLALAVRFTYRAIEFYWSSQIGPINGPDAVLYLVLRINAEYAVALYVILAIIFQLVGFYENPTYKLIVTLWERVNVLEKTVNARQSEQTSPGDRLKAPPEK